MKPIEVRKLISDRLGQALEPAVTVAQHSAAGAPPDLTEREFVEAVLSLIRTGCPWRDLPAALGSWHAVYLPFRRWEERGVWQRLWKNLKTPSLAQARALCVDSTTVRAHHHAARAPKKNGAQQGLGRSRGGWTTKSHAATIDEHCSVALHRTPRQAHDGRNFESPSDRLDPDNVLESAALDQGYDTKPADGGGSLLGNELRGANGHGGEMRVPAPRGPDRVGVTQ